VTSRSASSVRWQHSISVKLALTLGLAMFSIQFLVSIVIARTFRARLADLDTTGRAASAPFVNYLRARLYRGADGQWAPTSEALQVIETFLPADETFLWLDAEDRVVAGGRRILDKVDVGSVWPLCDSPEYCEVQFAQGSPAGGSTWSKLAIGDEAIGTFVLVWFTDPELALALGQGQVYADLASRLVAAAFLAALTSVLLVRLVTRRLSRLAVDATAPLDPNVETVDLPGPFNVQGNDEIARLATALNTMRDRIEHLVERLADRDRQRREWVALVSHDLRTPLTALSACLERLRDRLAKADRLNDVVGLGDAVGVACQDSERLHVLVDDLFELARLDAGETLNLEPVPPGELVRHTVRNLRPMAEAEQVELHAVVSPALPTIQADGRRMMRALENMVRNAVHFSQHRVEVAVYTDGDCMRFEVRDDGPGLPEVDGQVIVGKAEHHQRHAGSTGLGLIVTRRVAAAHGGSLGGDNRPEGGARVWVRIPIVAAHPPAEVGTLFLSG
jgi:signal transduction histidine kinase